jgi:hypothetical protein
MDLKMRDDGWKGKKKKIVSLLQFGINNQRKRKKKCFGGIDVKVEKKKHIEYRFHI